MNPPSRSSLRPALIVIIAIGAVACTGGGPSSLVSPGGGPSVRPSGAQGPGSGTTFIGTDQWPLCLNPVTACGTAPAYRSLVHALVLPRLIQYSNTMALEPSPLIMRVPTLANGDLSESPSPLTVTYHLNPAAVWSDGTPITCDDVSFTWRAILNTVGTASTYGYDGTGDAPGIRLVDCPDPRTVKLQFNEIFVDWPDLFGGANGFVLERAAFPNADFLKPDLKSEMQSTLPFSGGPWILERWSKDQEVVVRNDKYWDPQSRMDQVIFVRLRDLADEIRSLVSGEVDAISPQASNARFAEPFGGDPNIATAGGDSNSVEALWFQLDDPVMKDLRVRQAFAFAVDRDAVSAAVAAPNDPTATTNQCGPWIPGQGPWCPASGPFAGYVYDPAKADALLTQAGYDCSLVASGGPCTKDGNPLTITISTIAKGDREARIVSLLQQEAAIAGIDVQARTYAASDLRSNVLPVGEFQVALFPYGPIYDPSVTSLFGCDQLSTQGNDYGGGNFVRLCSKPADDLMRHGDQELDVTKRAQDIQQLGRLLATDLPMLPLFTQPNVAAWRTDKIGGVDPGDVSSPYGFFFNMATWYPAA